MFILRMFMFFFLVILMNETFFHKKNIVSCNVFCYWGSILFLFTLLLALVIFLKCTCWSCPSNFLSTFKIHFLLFSFQKIWTVQFCICSLSYMFMIMTILLMQLRGFESWKYKFG
jgi:hypothetical protein